MRPGPKQPAPASVDVDVSDFDKGPAAAKGLPPGPSALRQAGSAEVGRLIAAKGPAGNPNAAQGAADLASDKQAGGVGFLNALIRKFRPLAPAQGQQGQLTSQRFHGTTALRRGEARMSKAALALAEMGDCAVCKKPESKCLCKGISGVNHNRTMMKVSTKRSAKKSR